VDEHLDRRNAIAVTGVLEVGGVWARGFVVSLAVLAERAGGVGDAGRVRNDDTGELGGPANGEVLVRKTTAGNREHGGG
jgi:hypothetical protein